MKMFDKVSTIVLTLVAVLGLTGPIVTFAAGPATVNIGSAGNYVILAKTAITTTPGVVDTSITGNVGLSPAAGAPPYLTGFGQTMDGSGAFSTSALVTGRIYAANYASSTSAALTADVSAMEAAYTDAHDRAHGTGATNLNVGGGTLNGQNFVPGTYTWDTPGSVTITGDITLTGSASDIWIFQISGTLNIDSGKKIILAGGAQPQNVFWQVAGAVTLITGSQFQGIILAQTNIAMQDGATLNGRALAQTAVTLIGNTILISNPVTVAPIVAGRRRTPRPVPIVPIIGLLKIPTPLALPTGPGQVTYNYSVWNVAKLQQLTDVTVVDDKCSPVILISGDTNNNGKLDLDETWHYSCMSALLSGTTTNTAIATAHSTDGYYNTAIATAIATVVVGTPIQPPLIHITKVPSQLSSLPFGGGDITYSYTVTNPGVVAIHDVSVTDDKCSNITAVSVDQNGNGLLDTNEAWAYTCKTNVKVSTGSVASAKGDANSLTAVAYAFTNVLVAVPSLPNTGLTSEGVNISWSTIILSAIILVLGTSLVMVMKKREI